MKFIESKTTIGKIGEIGTRLGLAGFILAVGSLVFYLTAKEIKENPRAAYESFCNGMYASNIDGLVNYNPPFPMRFKWRGE